ncbi:NAD(P)H-binding protein [Kineococcus sp. SYSU DK003]|uniref:NAD(P)H-binding protein n=1 Tax=Kineococcus sp. SYSU DK003 TaxID=3383124 RepID=UPI003D7F0BBF
MQIAVTTPTGNVGHHLVPMLLRAGTRPRVLVRDPDRLPPGIRPHVEVAVADQFDTAQVVAATRGVDALYWVDPPVAGEDPLADHARATAAVVAAVEANAIGRVVFQSSVGAELRHGAGEIDGLAGTELGLDATAAAVTHLRCGFFFSNLLLELDAIRAGRVQVVLPLDHPMAWVAPRDIAEVAATRLLNPDWSGRVVQAVHGPEDLTWSGAAAVVSAATGVRLTVERVADEELREAMRSAGMSEAFADAVLGMSTGLREGFRPEQPRTAQTTTPTTLGAWSYETLRPLLAR